ncbi:DUF427 domain-containing protein [Gracilimonas sp. Q87]|uniref:DUF427 domain-containing protein n=1 Tax=Gracilimonas sp. Q87 TaxID=3384766 RepID=UPI00398450CC
MSTKINGEDPSRSGWKYYGQKRPEFAEEPKDGQESVWDYPRPPAVDKESREVLVIFENKIIARSTSALKLKETGHPPSIYVPKGDINSDYLKKSQGLTRCEWKGEATFWNVVVDDKIAEQAAWCYPQPNKEYNNIKSYFSFYPSKLFCYLNGEHVEPQPGNFYGGWVTKEIVGPVKGASDETYL